MLDHFQMGPNLVRGFASNGIGPRDITYYDLGATGDALGGTKYWGASAELQMPFWFLPKEVGLKGVGLRGRGLALGLQRSDLVGRNRRSQFAGLSELRPAIRRRQIKYAPRSASA